MKNILLIFFGVFVAIPAICQTTKVIFFNPNDVFNFGNNTSVIRFDSRLIFDYKYIQSNSIDTVNYEELIRVMVPQGQPGDKWIVTLRKLGAVVPPVEPPIVTPLTIEAENMAVVNATISGTFVQHIKTTSTLSYAIPTAKTKISVVYSRGNTGDGTVQLRTGSATATPFATIQLPFTGGWSTFKQFPSLNIMLNTNIPAGILFMTFPMDGAANFDKFTVE